MVEVVMTSKPCPTGCGRTARTGMLACGPCWREIPRHLQREVLRTWSTWRKDFGNAEAMRAYREASDNALGSIK